jgi:hypothetical protein
MALTADTPTPQNAAAKINLNGTFIFFPYQPFTITSGDNISDEYAANRYSSLPYRKNTLTPARNPPLLKPDIRQDF